MVWSLRTKKGHITAIGDMTFLLRLIQEIEWVKSPRH